MSNGVGFVVVRQIQTGDWLVMHRGRLYADWQSAAQVRDQMSGLASAGPVRVARVWVDDVRSLGE